MADREALLLRGKEDFLVEIFSSISAHKTGNTLIFLDKTKHRLREVLVQRRKRLNVRSSDVEKCCVSLHVMSLMMSYIVRELSDDQVSRGTGCGLCFLARFTIRI